MKTKSHKLIPYRLLTVIGSLGLLVLIAYAAKVYLQPSAKAAFLPDSIVTSISPSSGDWTTGTTITIHGSNFSPVGPVGSHGSTTRWVRPVQVYFFDAGLLSGVYLPIVSQVDTIIEVAIPPKFGQRQAYLPPNGVALDIRVAFSNNVSENCSNEYLIKKAFAFTGVPPGPHDSGSATPTAPVPVIDSVSPTSLSPAILFGNLAPQQITIRGSNFGDNEQKRGYLYLSDVTPRSCTSGQGGGTGLDIVSWSDKVIVATIGGKDRPLYDQISLPPIDKDSKVLNLALTKDQTKSPVDPTNRVIREHAISILGINFAACTGGLDGNMLNPDACAGLLSGTDSDTTASGTDTGLNNNLSNGSGGSVTNSDANGAVNNSAINNNVINNGAGNFNALNNTVNNPTSGSSGSTYNNATNQSALAPKAPVPSVAPPTSSNNSKKSVAWFAVGLLALIAIWSGYRWWRSRMVK